jgi:GntR family transcriptional regulator
MSRNARPTQKNENTLDLNSPLPLHYQLREIIRFEALNGDLADENGKMPTESELMDRFNVSRITVRSALQNLVDQGILHRERGKGTFLKTNSVENWSGKLLGFSESIAAAGYAPGAKVLKHGKAPQAPHYVRQKMLEMSLWELRRLRYADETTIAIEHSWFPEDIGEFFDRRDLSKLVTYKLLESEYGIFLNSGKQTVSAVNANEEEAELLGVEPGTALLFIERLIYSSEQRPIEFLESVYRPDYFQYSVQLQR